MNKINLVVDIGNTHIVTGIYRQNRIINSWRMQTDKMRTEDEYFSLLKGMLSSVDLQPEDINRTAIASVVPVLTRAFRHLINKYFNGELKVVNAYTELGLTFPVDDPGYIGADLIVNAFAAMRKYSENCIICDLGTATTIQLIGKTGEFFGKIIAPGVLTSSGNLFEKASLLSSIEITSPEKLLGTSTEQALLSGIVTGNSIMIDGFIQKIKSEYSHLKTFKTIATGGIAELICQNSSQIDIFDKNLTLDGLNIICLEK